MISFFVPGKPRATQTGSVIKVGGRAFPVRRNTPWSAFCGLVAKEHAPEVPIEGAVSVELTFQLQRPKSKSAQRPYPTGRPDAENMIKGLLDSWNGTLWRDDSQIVELRVKKVYADTPGVVVEIQSL